MYRFGRGEPILLMPGPHRFERPGLRMADALIEGLVRLDRQVITYDPPGSGHSSRPARLGMAEMHRCADEALGAAGVRGTVDSVGHSMGVLAVLAYALERPERVRRLVLIGAGSGGPAYTRAPGALWNRSHPRFRRMALLGILHILWPTRGPERIMNNFIEREIGLRPAPGGGFGARADPVRPLRPAVSPGLLTGAGRRDTAGRADVLGAQRSQPLR